MLAGNDLRQEALEAVRLSRDFTPKDGRHYSPAEAQELNRLCGIAYRACIAAGTSISEMRLALWAQEREAFRAALMRGEVTL